MPRINEAFLNLRASYLFAEVKRRTQAHRDAHPGVRLIDLGIGDVTLPLPAVVVRALEEAAREQARAETLKGYGPYVGYEFLRAEIAAHDFGARGVQFGPATAGNEHEGSLFREPFRSRQADPRAAAGDNRNFSFQLPCHDTLHFE